MLKKISTFFLITICGLCCLFLSSPKSSKILGDTNLKQDSKENFLEVIPLPQTSTTPIPTKTTIEKEKPTPKLTQLPSLKPTLPPELNPNETMPPTLTPTSIPPSPEISPVSKQIEPKGNNQTDSLSAERLENLVNEWRNSIDLPEFTQSLATCELAEKRLATVRTNPSHTGFTTLSEKIAPKYEPDQTQTIHFAENIALDWSTEEAVLSAWLNSASHKQNLLVNFPFMCIRTTENVVVQIFSNI